jgi:hypothetical protein
MLWPKERMIAAMEAHRARKAEFCHHVKIYVPKADNDSKMDKERYREVLDVLYAIARPIKGNRPQQDKWMITGRMTSKTAYRSFTVRFRCPRDATYFKLKCGGA